jgi:hypothetical protein
MLLRSCRTLVAVGALLAAVGLTACGGAISSPAGLATQTPQPSALPTPTPVGLETPTAGKIYLGAYAFATKSAATDVQVLEAQIGRKLAMDMHYDAWTGTFPGPLDASDILAGRLPVDSWNCQLSSAQIVAGAGDPLIKTRALALKSFGHPVFVRYLWDMNLAAGVLRRGPCYDAATDNPDGTFSATEFVLAWQHIRQIFTQEGVNNVVWVWNVAATGVAPAPYYPGDAYVDWVGIDAYDTAGVGFGATIAPIYALAAVYHKPILIGETGATPFDQAAFLQAAVPALQTQFPLVDGLVYYDAVSPFADLTLSSPGIIEFAALGSQPYVSAFASL